MLLWKLGYKYLFKLMFLFISDIYPGTKLLGHTVVLFLGCCSFATPLAYRSSLARDWHEQQQWQHQLLNPLSHQETPISVFFWENSTLFSTVGSCRRTFTQSYFSLDNFLKGQSFNLESFFIVTVGNIYVMMQNLYSL